MAPVLRYEELKMEAVDALLSENNELLVSLPEKHASALISFIETVRTCQSWGPKHVPRHARLLPLAKGLWVTLLVLLKHSKLFELGRVIVLNSKSQMWEHLPNGEVLFRFGK